MRRYIITFRSLATVIHLAGNMVECVTEAHRIYGGHEIIKIELEQP